MLCEALRCKCGGYKFRARQKFIHEFCERDLFLGGDDLGSRTVGAVAGDAWLQRTSEDSRLSPRIAELSYTILTSPQFPSFDSETIVRLLLTWECWLALLPPTSLSQIVTTGSLVIPKAAYVFFTGRAVRQLRLTIFNTSCGSSILQSLFTLAGAPAWCSPTDTDAFCPACVIAGLFMFYREVERIV